MKATSLLLSIVLITVAGCAARGPDPAAEARAEAIEDILREPLAESEYAEDVRCLTTHAYRNIEILDDRNVLFYGSGQRVWLNQLRQRCPGLRRNDTLQFNLRDGRICSLDSFHATENFFRFWQRTSSTCLLGPFKPVTQEQAEAIKAAARERR